MVAAAESAGRAKRAAQMNLAVLCLHCLSSRFRDPGKTTMSIMGFSRVHVHYVSKDWMMRSTSRCQISCQLQLSLAAAAVHSSRVEFFYVRESCVCLLNLRRYKGISAQATLNICVQHNSLSKHKDKMLVLKYVCVLFPSIVDAKESDAVCPGWTIFCCTLNCDVQ